MERWAEITCAAFSSCDIRFKIPGMSDSERRRLYRLAGCGSWSIFQSEVGCSRIEHRTIQPDTGHTS